MKATDDVLITQLEKGEKLFHYTSAEGLQGIIGGEFWVTESSFLNDTTEFQVATDVFCELLTDRVSNENACAKIQTAVCDEVNRLTCQAHKEDAAYFGDYVISFCLDKDSALMWSEYSGSGGYCIEFDFDRLLNSFPKPKEIFHGKVVYDHDEQLALMTKLIENEFFNDSEYYTYLTSWEDMEQLTDEQIHDMTPHMSVLISCYNMFFKKECFSGENEYRFIFSCFHDGCLCRDDDYVKQYFRNRNGVLIPFVKQPLNSLNSIRSIIIGPKNNSDIAAKGVTYLLRNRKITVPVIKSMMPLRY